MSTIEDAIHSVGFGEDKECYIPCKDKTYQESVRIMSYAVRRRMFDKNQRENIGITKIEENENLYVKVYKKPPTPVFIRDEKTGNLIPKESKIADPELQRIISLMQKDNKSEKEIQEMKDSWGEEENPEDFQLPKPGKSAREIEKEEMRKLSNSEK